MPSLFRLRDHIEDGVDQHRGQAHRRLVHQQDSGFQHQPAAGGQHLLLAARERAAFLVEALFKAREERKDFFHALADFRGLLMV